MTTNCDSVSKLDWQVFILNPKDISIEAACKGNG